MKKLKLLLLTLVVATTSQISVAQVNLDAITEHIASIIQNPVTEVDYTFSYDYDVSSEFI